MRPFHQKYFSIVLIVAIAMTSLSCEEASDSENGIQKSLNSLLLDLQVATSGSNVDGLEAIIASANRIRPSSQSQIQSKNLLLSTAKEKLAQLKFQSLLAQSTAMTTVLQLAENQAMQVSLLRDSADSLATGSSQSGKLKSQEITSAQESIKDTYNSQLMQANADVADLDSKSQTSRTKAQDLREKADQMLNEAEDKGIVDGHTTYKSGVRTMRKSQKADLTAATVELQSNMRAQPLRDDAKAELEAIASILNGMQHTENLLQHLKNTTIQNAADFRKLADELDAQTAETMSEAIEIGSKLVQEWTELSTLVQGAMKGTGRSNRGASREAQHTNSIWKLDLEWTLGQVEEAKRNLLLEESRTIQALIEHGIVTTSSKWQELSVSILNQIDQATLSAITAYENARQLASTAGAQGDAFIQQLDTRVAVLQGKEIPRPATNDTSTSTSGTASTTSGFATPQALVNAFNTVTDINAYDGSTPVPDLNDFFVSEDSEKDSFVSFLNDMLQSSGNLLIAVREKMGQEAVAELKAMSPVQSNQTMMKVDPTSIVQIDEKNAAGREVSGKPMYFRLTDQGWKIFLENKNDPEADMASSMMRELLTPMLQVTNTVTQQIKDGEITTVEQINEALMSAMENMNPF